MLKNCLRKFFPWHFDGYKNSPLAVRIEPAGRCVMFMSFLSLDNYSGPAVDVGFGAVLDATEQVVEFGGDGAWFAVFGNDVALFQVEVVNLADRRNDGSGATGSGFLEGVEFFFWNLATFHLHAKIFCQLHQALVGDAGQDGG